MTDFWYVLHYNRLNCNGVHNTIQIEDITVWANFNLARHVNCFYIQSNLTWFNLQWIKMKKVQIIETDWTQSIKFIRILCHSPDFSLGFMCELRWFVQLQHYIIKFPLLSLLCMCVSQDLSRNCPVVFLYSRFLHNVQILPLDIGKSLGNVHASLITITDLHMLHHLPSAWSVTPSILTNFTFTFALKSSSKSFVMSFLDWVLTATSTLCEIISSRPSLAGCVR